MKKKIIIFVLIIIILVAGALFYLSYKRLIYLRTPLLILTQPKITYIFGKVEIKESEHNGWKSAALGMNLSEGTQIQTKKDSRADIKFHSDLVILLRENSKMSLNELFIDQIMMKLIKGSFFGKFKRLFQKQKIGIQTPTVVAAVRGTELGFIVHEINNEDKKEENPFPNLNEKSKSDDNEEKMNKEKATTVYTLSGISEIYNPKNANKKMLLSYNNKSIVFENKAPSEPVKIPQKEKDFIRKILNSIHTEVALFISNKIQFFPNTAKIKPKSFKELNKVVELLKGNNHKTRIEGHSAGVKGKGNTYFIKNLSLQRAKAIKDYLIKNGIKSDRLFTRGYGSSRPIADNSTKAGKAKNRRVEFIVID